MSVIPSADAIATAVQAATLGGLPPVHLWNPPDCGAIDIRIAADGTWYHEGGPITRIQLARLFSTILRKEGDSYYLVTPAEKVKIEVEDVPFFAIDMQVDGEGDAQILRFVTSMGDTVTAGSDHPLRLTGDIASPRPYVEVRNGLDARIDRKSFYRLVDRGETRDIDGTEWFGVWSSSTFMPLAKAAVLYG